MNSLALLLLLAATRVGIVDETFEIPAGEWRYMDDLRIRQNPVLIVAAFVVDEGGPPMRLLLVRREDVDRLRDARPHGILASTPTARAGHLRFIVHGAGDFAVVLDNRLNPSRAVRARLNVALDFSVRGGPAARYASPQRRLTVIVLSFLFFLAVATWSARRIIRSLRR